METYIAANWRIVMLAVQMFFGVSLMVTGLAGKYRAARSFLTGMIPYFFSFFPLALLFYCLYQVFRMSR